MNELINEILVLYVKIQRKENGITNFELTDTEYLLSKLDTTTLGDILADLKFKSKEEK
jgi:hypothetical protein